MARENYTEKLKSFIARLKILGKDTKDLINAKAADNNTIKKYWATGTIEKRVVLAIEEQLVKWEKEKDGLTPEPVITYVGRRKFEVKLRVSGFETGSQQIDVEELHGEFEEFGDEVFLAQVHGNSRAPIAFDGQFLFLKPGVPKTNDLVVAIFDDKKSYFKRLLIDANGWHLFSDNQYTNGRAALTNIKDRIQHIYKVIGVKFE